MSGEDERPSGRGAQRLHLCIGAVEVCAELPVGSLDGHGRAFAVVPPSVDQYCEHRVASGIELPGFRELLDKTMEEQDQAKRKEAFAQLQKFVLENALQMVQFISPACAVHNAKVQNFHDSLLAVAKFTEVWLSPAA